MIVPPRTLVAGIPARVLRELTDDELAWKVEGTASYLELTRRSLATMRATTPLSAPEPDRRRIDAAGAPAAVRAEGAGHADATAPRESRLP